MSGPIVSWHQSQVSAADRSRVLRQRGAAIWLTGLSGSGKSTIGVALERRLVDAGHLAFLLDGDNVRHGLCADLGFDAKDRAENIRRVGQVARLMAEAGLLVVVSFISPYRADRDLARALFEPGHFIEAHVATPLAICERRDPKGLYKKARDGLIQDFTGITAPYEPPVLPEVVLSTEGRTLEACVDEVWAVLESRGLLKPSS